MSNCKDVWFDVYRRFEHLYPGLAKDVVNWYPSGRNEITLVYEDRTKFTYNSYSDVVRVIYYGEDADKFEVGDGEDVSEYAWRAAFSRRLRAKMRESRMSQSALSEKSGISISTISRYLNACDMMPGAYNITRLASALGCSTSDLMDHFN